MNQQAKYLGQTLFSSKVIIVRTSNTGKIALPEPLKLIVLAISAFC